MSQREYSGDLCVENYDDMENPYDDELEEFIRRLLFLQHRIVDLCGIFFVVNPL